MYFEYRLCYHNNTYLVFFLISSTNCLMWSSINSIFSFFRACAFCSLTILSINMALSTSGKLSTAPDDPVFSGDRSSALLRALMDPKDKKSSDTVLCLQSSLIPYYFFWYHFQTVNLTIAQNITWVIPGLSSYFWIHW